MEKGTPSVSVIIPAYNQGNFLREAIQSALSQAYRNFEIVVVDDGSTDNSPQVIAEFGEKVRSVRQENRGLAGARNTGILAAKGALIGLLDADDQWQPEYLTKMVALSEQYPAAAVYYCQAQCMNSNGGMLERTLGGPVRSPDRIYPTLLRANFLIPSTILMRRSMIIEAGLFDQSLRSCEDWDLWLRLLPEHTFIGTMDCLVKYRLHGSSLSTNLDGMHQAARKTIEKNFGEEKGECTDWSVEKRRAYGGFYRYQTLTYIQRQNNWQAALPHLMQALKVDPTLAKDIDFYYDLALGSQPVGLRGTHKQLELQKNADHMVEMLKAIFDLTSDRRLIAIRRTTYGTAYYALGLVAYNTYNPALSRSYFVNAIRYRPDLCGDLKLIGSLVRANIPPSLLDTMRKYKNFPGSRR